jgi:hypothetical protein
MADFDGHWTFPSFTVYSCRFAPSRDFKTQRSLDSHAVLKIRSVSSRNTPRFCLHYHWNLTYPVEPLRTTLTGIINRLAGRTSWIRKVLEGF